MKLWLSLSDVSDVDDNAYDVLNSADELDSNEVELQLEFYNDHIQKSGPFPAEAIEPLETLLKYYPNHEEILIRLAYLLYEGEFNQVEALKNLAIILKANPTHQEALKLCITIYFEHDQFVEMLPHLTALIACEPDVVNHFALHRRAEAYYALNRFDEALADLNQTLSGAAFAAAASRQASREQAQDWINHYEYVEYEEDKQFDACLLLRSRVHQAKNDLPCACIDLDIYLKEHPEDMEALALRSRVHLAQGNLLLARADLDKYLEKDSKNIAMLNHRIAVCEQQADTDQVTLDKYSIYKAKHIVSKLDVARAVLAFHQSAVASASSSSVVKHGDSDSEDDEAGHEAKRVKMTHQI